MAKLNIANMNTLFRKGYLLAGVVMAANMFVVNEVKASNMEGENEFDNSEEEKLNKEGRKKIEEDKNNKKKFLPHKDTTRNILFRENYFNFFGTLALSVANNYFKLWNYDAGIYCKFVWFGWRSKRFLNDMFQFDINLNLVRGILWLFPGYLFFFVQGGFLTYTTKTACSFAISLQFFTLSHEDEEIKNHFRRKIIVFPLFILQGFISAPLTWHISNFSIAISLDSIFWELVTMVAIWAHERINPVEKLSLWEKVK